MLLRSSALNPRAQRDALTSEENENVAPDSDEQRANQRHRQLRGQTSSGLEAPLPPPDETEDNMVFHSCVQQTEDLIKPGPFSRQGSLEDSLKPGQRLEDLLQAPHPVQLSANRLAVAASNRDLDVVKPKETEGSLDEIEDDDHEHSIAQSMSARQRDSVTHP